MNTSEVRELMLRRRRQLLVHSIIYYRFNENLISDATWTKWALELEDLQKRYPKIASELPWSEEYANFDHSTGYNLPLTDPWAVHTAMRLLRMTEPEIQDDIDHILDTLFWDEERKCVMQSITVQGGDVEQVPCLGHD